LQGGFVVGHIEDRKVSYDQEISPLETFTSKASGCGSILRSVKNIAHEVAWLHPLLILSPFAAHRWKAPEFQRFLDPEIHDCNEEKM